LLALSAGAEVPAKLPTVFKTLSGVEIKNGRVLSQSDSGLKIMHDNGIVTLGAKDLPEDLARLFGVMTDVESDDAKPLPSVLSFEGRQYTNVELAGVDPDGIRFKHADGLSKIVYEKLPANLVSDYGPFDEKLAISYRSQQQEHQRELSKARLEHLRRENAEAAKAQTPTGSMPQDPPVEQARENEGVVSGGSPSSSINQKASPLVLVKLAGRSSGGKDRNVTWSTSWGSYNRTDTSFRSIRCLVTSLAAGPQIARLQCLFIVRPVGGSLTARMVLRLECASKRGTSILAGVGEYWTGKAE
jgi:hypothetical protein